MSTFKTGDTAENSENINNFSIFQKQLNSKTKNENTNSNTFPNNESSNINSISFQNTLSHNNLISLIQILQQENNLLKNNSNITQKVEKRYSDTIQYKLISLKNEIENLKRIIANKDNIIMNMQNFINNITKIVLNGKINLSINQTDIKALNNNLKEIEKNIISKFQKMQKFNKIPQPKLSNQRANIIQRKRTEPVFDYNKKYFHSIPLKRNSNKTNMSIKSNFNRSKNLFNKSKNEESINNKNINKINNKNNNKNINKNKNNECVDIRCGTCRSKSKNNQKFYKERIKLRLKGFLLTKPEGIFSRTPKKHNKSGKVNQYKDYLKNVSVGKINHKNINIK